MAYLTLIITLIVLLSSAGALFWATSPLPPEPIAELRIEFPRVAPARPAITEPRTRHPIVLVHGLMGFDSFGVGKLRQDYFRGVRARLERVGNRVSVVRLPSIAGVKSRAVELERQVRALDAERVNLIAHSMGGLDARYAISKLGLADRVASLTTIGTPHYGTPLADRGTWLLRRADALTRLMERVGADGICDVTTERMVVFNREVPDVMGVEYLSYIASIERGIARAHPFAWPGLLMLRASSDGLVPADSQRWGSVAGEITADHWAQIGWASGFDAASLYERIALELAQRGF